jgi:four helix bundle protein
MEKERPRTMDDGLLALIWRILMAFKFEQLEVWQLAMEYIDDIYMLAGVLPHSEDYNLKSQIIRAATSVALNIAEGSTGQTNAEQARFLGMAIRSLVETVACQHLIRRRHYVNDESSINMVYSKSQLLVCKLQSFRKSLLPAAGQIREETCFYSIETDEI